MIKIAKKENILYELHESLFIGYTFKNNNLILRVAINCAVTDLDPNCEFGEKYYLYDIVCHQCNILEDTCSQYSDLVLNEVLTFNVYENKYDFTILIDAIEFAQIIFNCESIEWIPIKEFTGSEINYIEETEYINIK